MRTPTFRCTRAQVPLLKSSGVHSRPVPKLGPFEIGVKSPAARAESLPQPVHCGGPDQVARASLPDRPGGAHASLRRLRRRCHGPLAGCAFYLFIRQPHGSEVSPAARNSLDSAPIPTASKLLICGLFQKGRVLAQDGSTVPALDPTGIPYQQLKTRAAVFCTCRCVVITF